MKRLKTTEKVQKILSKQAGKVDRWVIHQRTCRIIFFIFIIIRFIIMGVRLEAYLENFYIPQFSGSVYDKKRFFGQSHWSFNSEFLVH